MSHKNCSINIKYHLIITTFLTYQYKALKKKILRTNLLKSVHIIQINLSILKRDMGLLIQRIDPTGRISHDGRIKAGDRIVEINSQSLIGVEFKSAQEVLRKALHLATTQLGKLELKLVRNLDIANSFFSSSSSTSSYTNSSESNTNNNLTNPNEQEETDSLKFSDELVNLHEQVEDAQPDLSNGILF